MSRAEQSRAEQSRAEQSRAEIIFLVNTLAVKLKSDIVKSFHITFGVS